MNVVLLIVLVGCIGYLVRRWFRRHAIEVRPAVPNVAPSTAPTRPGLLDQFAIASAAISNAEGIRAVESFCLACIDGTGPKARAALGRALSAKLGDAGVLVRHLEVAFESLAIIENTKNDETLMSRLSVARQALYQACAEAGHVFPDEHRDRLIAIVDEAASGRLADLAIAKVEHLKAKASAAKTEATRAKHLAAAKAYAAEAARQANISTPDRARIRAQVTA